MIRKLDMNILKRIGMAPPRKYTTIRMYGATIVSIHLYPDLLSPFLKDKLKYYTPTRKQIFNSFAR